MEQSYKKIILKLSGEALLDKNANAILSKDKLLEIANLIKDLRQNDVKIGVVIGAGNIFRGRISQDLGVNPIDGDYMGMIGTVINCKALSSVLNSLGVKNKVFGALAVEDVAPKYDPEEALKLVDEGYVCLFSGGLGRPKITTDSCAAKRAIEIKAEAILSGKNGVDGVYDSDPRTNKNAKFLKNLTYKEAIASSLKVMDKEAMELLKDSDVVTRVFGMNDIENFKKVVSGSDIGSTIRR